MAKQLEDLERRLSLDGPQTDDELHAWITRNIGINMPRTAVCEGHVAPFQFIADLFFQRTVSVVAMANRGGSKTFGVAVLHLLNMLYRPGIECATVGAIEQQARRAYMHFQKLIDQCAKDAVATSLMSETRFKNGSRLEILPGTVNAVNGPHPQIVHFDEVELMDPEVYQEGQNMPAGKKINDKQFNAISVITSTRKRGIGMMQSLIDEISEAKLQGAQAPYELYAWCIYETAAAVNNCQVAYPDLSEEERCPCATVIKGRWENGQPRSLKDCCQGRLARSDGWIPFDDVASTFTKVSQDIWEAQQECSKPSTAGLVMPQFSRERHGIRRWDPDPTLGPIYMSIDFGGTNPHAVNWYQVLRYEVECTSFNGTTKRLPEGSRVCFDEIYIAEVGNNKIADMIANKERLWRERHKHFRISKRFADPQAKAARLDFARHDPPLPTVFVTTREVQEHIKMCANLLEDDLFFVDVDRCEMFVEEIEGWHYPKKKAHMVDDPDKPVEDFDHCMSNWRYCMSNISVIEKSGAMSRKAVPSAGVRQHPTAKGAGRDSRLPAYLPNSRGLPPSETWRKSLGQPVTGA